MFERRLVDTKKIAFIRVWEGLISSDSVLAMLKMIFPNYQFVEIIIFPDLVNRRNLINLYRCLREYGIDILRNKKNIYLSIYRSPHYFYKVKKRILDLISDKGYTFSFQTQSIFDASVAGIPHFVYTDHTHLANLSYPGFDPEDLYSPAWIECEQTIYQNATLNFTRSSNITRLIIDDYSCDPEKVVCVFTGPNLSIASDERWDGSRYAKKSILFNGVDWERKGGQTLVAAFRRVLEKFPDAKLTIIGACPDLDLPNTDVVGRIPLSEIGGYLKEASIFCLPTENEPFGIVFIEAMAHKLPIVATNIGAIPDFVHQGKDGFLVDPGDVDQLAQKLIELLRSKEKCKSFGEYGHKLFWERYTWEKTGEIIRRNVEASI